VIPDLVRRIDLADMVAYAGATWDWHRLHYDTGYVAERGLPAPVVDGQVLGALLAEHVLDHFGPRAFITEMSFRFAAKVFAGDTVTVSGTAVEQDGSAVVTQRVTAGDGVAIEAATTTVRLRP